MVSSTDKMRKLLEKTYNYQVKIDDNLQKFDTLLETNVSDWYHINYDGSWSNWLLDSKDFIDCLEEKIKIFWEKYQCKDWQEFQEDFVNKCNGY